MNLDPSYEELEEELEQARASRERWKEFALALRRVLNEISTNPSNAERLAAYALALTPGKP